jgi:CheY-like chemotaxis protein
MTAEQPGRDRRKRALVIDDDASVRRALVDVVAMLGYEADAAANGPQGIALFVRSRYDVVLTDLMMPGMTGWQVLDTIRELNLRIPVILVTGAPIAPDDRRLARPGVALVRKPVDAGALEAALARLLPP